MSPLENDENHDPEICIETYYENNPQLIMDRVSSTEKKFQELSFAFNNLVQTKTQMRDRTDAVTLILNDFGVLDGANSVVSNLARGLAACQEPLDRASERLNLTAAKTLQSTLKFCPTARVQIKKAVKSRTVELKAAQRIARNREKGISDYRKLAKRASESQTATENASKARNILMDAIETFERKRFNDLHCVLRDYVLSELNYHAKSVECFTNCFKLLNSFKFNPRDLYYIAKTEIDSSITTNDDQNEIVSDLENRNDPNSNKMKNLAISSPKKATKSAELRSSENEISSSF